MQSDMCRDHLRRVQLQGAIRFIGYYGCWTVGNQCLRTFVRRIDVQRYATRDARSGACSRQRARQPGANLRVCPGTEV